MIALSLTQFGLITTGFTIMGFLVGLVVAFKTCNKRIKKLTEMLNV